MFKIRSGRREDAKSLAALYKIVSQTSGSLARTPEEITLTFVDWLIAEASKHGLWLVGEEEENLIGSILAHRPEPASLHHVLNYLTVTVHPYHQKKGLGRALFKEFLARIDSEFPEIQRVELFVRESNSHAIRLYESLGFEIEGRYRDRIRRQDGTLESDIPMAWLRGRLPKANGQ